MPTETTVAENPTVLATPPEVTLPTAAEVLYKPVPPAKTEPPTPPVEPVAPEKKDETTATPTDIKPPTEPAKTTVLETSPEALKDYDLKLPEGSLLSPEDLAVVQKEAKDAGLSKEQAEANLLSKSEAVKSFAARQEKTLTQAKNEWRDACSKDPEFGGEKFAENIALAQRAWNKVASPALKQMADATGFANHPEVVRAFVKVGRLMAEDSNIRGLTGPTSTPKSKEDILYGNPPSKERMS